MICVQVFGEASQVEFVLQHRNVYKRLLTRDAKRYRTIYSLVDC